MTGHTSLHVRQPLRAPRSVRARGTTAFAAIVATIGCALLLLCFAIDDDVPSAADCWGCVAALSALVALSAVLGWLLVGRLVAPLEASSIARERFAAHASHELRTPLATAKMLLRVARDDPAGVDVERLVDRLTDANDRSIRTVEALLELAESTQQGLDASPVDLRTAVAQATTRLASEARTAGVSVTTESAIGVLSDGDPVLIDRLVTNLLQNAIRHNHAGGRAHVDVVSAPGGNLVRVSNTGPIVSAADAARLTEPFFRTRARTPQRDRVSAGMGLGLALASNIVQVHNGTLVIRPNRSGGLTVTVTFPPARPA